MQTLPDDRRDEAEKLWRDDGLHSRKLAEGTASGKLTLTAGSEKKVTRSVDLEVARLPLIY